MGNPRGQRRDFEALERRRLEGLRLFRKGVPQAQIARELRVARQTVSRWVRQYREGGTQALRQAGRAGRPPKLGAAQLRQVERMLLAGPEAFGYPTPLWTCPRVAEVIEARFGVRYHPGHVWKLLRAMGFSCQRPVGRAVERDEKAVEPGKRKRWPAIKKSPQGGTDDRLHRRERHQPAAAPGVHLGAEGPDADFAGSLQTEIRCRPWPG
jgi:transposase